MKAIAIDGLAKAYAGKTVFENFSLRVERGEVVAILGPSGCGKSTLLRCIAGLERPDAGTVHVAGEIGMIFQEARLFPWQTVRDNIAFAARNAVEELAAQILKNAPLAVRAMKEATLKTRHLRADDAYLAARFLLEQVDSSLDSREGLLAFKEKRAPVWQAR